MTVESRALFGSGSLALAVAMPFVMLTMARLTAALAILEAQKARKQGEI
jgi:hypothetical protein